MSYQALEPEGCPCWDGIEGPENARPLETHALSRPFCSLPKAFLVTQAPLVAELQVAAEL